MAGSFCDKKLLLIEYLDIDQNPLGAGTDSNVPPVPSPCGHGYDGASGHYQGDCLCSPIGCRADFNYDSNRPCRGFPNPLGPTYLGTAQSANPNLAIVSEEFVQGWYPGRRWNIGEQVFVSAQPPVGLPSEHDGNSSTELDSESTTSKQYKTFHPVDPSDSELGPFPILWQRGVLGGRAVLREWKRCGGRNRHNSWHGSRILERSRWTVEDEDASILLLHEDGSHGLDLSFATHLFLLEKIRDPALENQIISRAHRMGATGPVQVVLLQVTSQSSATSSSDTISSMSAASAASTEPRQGQ